MKGTNTALRVDDRKNILISYHYFKGIDISTAIPEMFGTPLPRVFMDSGAFSAFNIGESISLDSYIAYCHKHRDVLWCVSNLDVMTSDRETLENQNAMEQAGLEPVPVFHTGDEWRYLDAYVERYPFIALGKIVPYSGSPKKLIPWVAKCMRVADSKSVYHAFGCSNMTLLKLFPFFSSDSSAWGSSYRYGQVPLWNEAKATMQMVQYADALGAYAQDRALWDEHGHAGLGALTHDKIPYKKIGVLSAIAYLKMADWLSRGKGGRYHYFFAFVPQDWDRVREAFAIHFPQRQENQR